MAEPRELAEMHVQVFNCRAWSKAPDIYAPDIVMIEPVGATHGIDGYLGTAKGFVTAFPDSRFDVTAVIASGNSVVMEGVYSGTHTGPLTTPQGEVAPTGRTLELTLCDVFDIEAGRIQRVRAYYDQMALAAQLGLLPTPAAS